MIMIHYDEEKWASQFSKEAQEPPSKIGCLAVIILVVTIMTLVFS